MKESIIFENSELIAAYKAPGDLSVDSRLGKDETRKVLSRALEAELKSQIFPVHRLDLEVQGLILYAKNARSHALLSNAFEFKSVTKTYFCISEFEFKEGRFSEEHFWTSQLVRGKKRSFEAPYGKKAETTAKCLKNINLKSKQCSYWELKPHTGRSHQLRFEMSRHQFPILGDSLYGSKAAFELGGIALQSYSLEFHDNELINHLKISPLLKCQNTLEELLK